MIQQLNIHKLRNLGQAELTLARCNLIIGANGSGKTSLLEAVFLLSRGKSFRHHEPRRYIRHHESDCTIWAKTFGDPSNTLAIQKKLDTQGKSDTLLRFNGQTAASQSVLSFQLPTLLIDPVGMSLLDEGSGTRRQLLDWLVFHMKPEFYQQWLQYQRLLKQRNSLLKQPSIQHRLNELLAWDGQLSYFAHALHEHRQEIFLAWETHFQQMLGLLLPEYQHSLSLQYVAGFDTKNPLIDTLRSRIDQDIELGYTRIGAHRADVSVLFKATNDQGQKIREQATHILSRGEKKLLITALKLSQLQLICNAISHSNSDATFPVVLIDDIDAELDNAAMQILLQTALSLPCQLIITSLTADTHHKILDILKHLPSHNTSEQAAYHMFHVEQGQFLPMHQL